MVVKDLRLKDKDKDLMSKDEDKVEDLSDCLIASLLLTLFLVVQPANWTRSANQFGYIYPP